MMDGFPAGGGKKRCSIAVENVMARKYMVGKLEKLEGLKMLKRPSNWKFGFEDKRVAHTEVNRSDWNSEQQRFSGKNNREPNLQISKSKLD